MIKKNHQEGNLGHIHEGLHQDLGRFWGHDANQVRISSRWWGKSQRNSPCRNKPAVLDTQDAYFIKLR